MSAPIITEEVSARRIRTRKGNAKVVVTMPGGVTRSLGGGRAARGRWVIVTQRQDPNGGFVYGAIGLRVDIRDAESECRRLVRPTYGRPSPYDNAAPVPVTEEPPEDWDYRNDVAEGNVWPEAEPITCGVCGGIGHWMHQCESSRVTP